MSSSSNKRKMSEVAVPKYYAVRAGHTPGVYTVWADCQKNITGFKGAQFKSFPTEREARDFLAGKATASASKPTGDKFYGVAVGHNPGVYEEWVDVQEQIAGVKGPKYKRFSTKAEALQFVHSGGRKSTVVKAARKAAPTNGDAGEPSSKRARTTTEPARTSKIKSIQVYTDGSSLGNGKQGADAGVGVFFGDADERNVSEPLHGKLQTNQRAELTAVQRALEIVPRDRDIQIISDSNYAINCVEVWYKNWLKNDWKTSQGGPVLNKDLVVLIRALIDERDESGATTTFQWIKGHSADPGNEAADKLAVAGAQAGRLNRCVMEGKWQ